MNRFVYLDSAATMQMPNEVLTEVTSFYQYENANIHRGIYERSERATARYEHTREVVCDFLGTSNREEIIFTSGTTGGVNMVAQMLAQIISPGDEILITQMEHHSNYLPWVELAKRTGAKLQIAQILSNGKLDMEDFEHRLNEKTRIVAVTEVSNVSGVRNPVVELAHMIREKTEALFLVDGAQGVCHGRILLNEYNPDFYVFSGHKLGAPTGIGVLYMKAKLQEQLAPVFFGGGMAEVQSGPSKYEAGTPNYAAAIGLGKAIKLFMEKEKPMDADAICRGGMGIDILLAIRPLAERESMLLSELERDLLEIPGIQILASGEKHYGCLSFIVNDLSSYDISRLLDHCGICVRSGHLCAKPYLGALDVDRVTRVSVCAETTKEELDYFVSALKEILYEYRALEAYRAKARFKGMTMEETEKAILEELNSFRSQKEKELYLAKWGEECLSFPKHFDRTGYEVNECQMQTTIISGWKDGRFVLYADSDTGIVRGILALLQQICVGRTKAELEAYHSSFFEDPVINLHGEFLKKRIEIYTKSAQML